MGNDFEQTKDGFVDYLLLDHQGFPFVVLEAKKEDKDRLDGKEQARRYAQTLNVRFVILSNGNLHYFWDLERGNPDIITEFPTQESLIHRLNFKPNNIKNWPMKKYMKTILPSVKIPSLRTIQNIKMKRQENNLLKIIILDF